MMEEEFRIEKNDYYALDSHVCYLFKAKEGEEGIKDMIFGYKSKGKIGSSFPSFFLVPLLYENVCYEVDAPNPHTIYRVQTGESERDTAHMLVCLLKHMSAAIVGEIS